LRIPSRTGLDLRGSDLFAEGGGPLLLRLENCLAYGINKNNMFGKDNYTIRLACFQLHHPDNLLIDTCWDSGWMALAEVAGVESFMYVAGFVLEEILGINFITQGVCVCE
jgi:hypothetical protein